MMTNEDFIPFGKPNFSQSEIDAVAKVLRNGWIGMGQETIEFEKELADFIGIEHVITVNSCTSALFLSLLINDVGEGDEVICPSLTWCSTANAALYLGAEAVFCDIDTETMSITVDSVLEKVSPKTKAVIIVHYGGLAIDVNHLRNKLPERVVIIEDAAHAFTSRYNDGTIVGSSGNLTSFSFYANKNLSTGEGGAIALDDNAKAGRLKTLRLHGLQHDAWKRFMSSKNFMTSALSVLGYKMNYTDLQASIGRVQLSRQNEFMKIRRIIAKIYFNCLSKIDLDIQFQKDILEDKHSLHLFVVMLPLNELKISRNDFILKMREENIGAAIHYMPLHLMPFYQQSNLRLYNTEKVADSILTLPISPSMTTNDANRICNVFSDLIIKYRK